MEGAKNVHKLLHRAKAPIDGGLTLRGDESEDDFGDDDEEEEQGAGKMDVGDEEGEVEEI